MVNKYKRAMNRDDMRRAQEDGITTLPRGYLA